MKYKRINNEHFLYNDNGQVIYCEDSQGRVYENEYNENGKIISFVDKDSYGNITFERTFWDESGFQKRYVNNHVDFILRR